MKALANLRSDRLRSLGKLALAMIGAQLVYWLILQPLLFERPDLPPRLEVSGFEAAVLSEPGKSGIRSASWQPVDLPWSDCCAPGYRAFRAQFHLDEIPDDGLGIIAYINADNAHIQVNGSTVLADGSLELDTLTQRRLRGLVHVPSGLLREGDNSILYIMTRAGPPYFDVNRAPILAPYEALRSAASRRLFIITDYGLISAGLGGVIALLAGVAALRAQRPAAAFWLCVIAAAWTARMLHTYWPEPFISPRAHLALLFVWLNLIPLGWFNFANEWSERPWGTMGWASGVLSALSTGACVILAGFMAHPGGFDLASDIVNLTGIALMLATGVRFAVDLRDRDDTRLPEVAVFSLIVSLLVLEALSELRFDLPAGHLQTTLPLLLLALVIAFVSRNVRLFASMSDLNAALKARVEEQERDLRAALERERETLRLRGQTEERQRIMRDMHDGLGGQILALLAAAKAGTLDPAGMRAGLDGLLTELRVVLDCLDGGDDPLGLALGRLRGRLNDRAEIEGFAFDWHLDAGVAQIKLGPKPLLDLARIIEEAFSNALRHAAPSRVGITLRPVEEAGELSLTIEDDGVGRSNRSTRGRGLRNMQVRAERLGERIAFQEARPGLRIHLTFPVPSDSGPDQATIDRETR